MKQTVSPSPAIHPGDRSMGPVAGRVPWPAVVAGLVWLAAGFSAGYWTLLAVGRQPPTRVAGAPVTLPVSEPAMVAGALGARAAPVTVEQGPAAQSVATRYTLLGVVYSPGRQGAALIAVGEEPARPYRVGATVDNGLVLQAVGRGSVRLGATVSGPTTVELTVPQLPAQTSWRTPVGGGAAGSVSEQLLSRQQQGPGQQGSQALPHAQVHVKQGSGLHVDEQQAVPGFG
jgi:general secretion pathway protein C